jgi:N6-adenosine-specific RNA methylase IME4
LANGSADTTVISLPAGPFATIIADPPWDYSRKLSGGGTSGYSPVHHSRGGSRGAANHYRTMTNEELVALPVPAIVADQAHLYLWTTGAFMVEAHAVAEAWGFAPKGIIPWVKLSRDWRSRVALEGSVDAGVRMGMGRYIRWCAEFVLFGVRGKLPTHRHDVLGVIHAVQRGHSQKPDELYDLVERASPGPRVELFARSRRPGYVSWGNEIPDESTSVAPSGDHRGATIMSGPAPHPRLCFGEIE